MSRRGLAVAAVVATLLLAGCASLTVHSEVNADGTIDRYRMQINTSATVYSLLNEQAKEDGYESLRESILSDVNRSNVGDVRYDEEFDGDDVTVTVEFTDVEPASDSRVSITRSDGRLVYEDTTFVNESAQPTDEQGFLSGLSVHYYLTMPGEITDSNADEVDGATAEWHETGPDAFTDNRVYAESEVADGPLGVGLPGFGARTALVALLALLAGIALRDR